MWPTVTDALTWSVCRSVCHDRKPCKNGWTDRDVVWDVHSGEPWEPCIRWGFRLQAPMRKGTFEEEGAAVSCAKTAQPIEMLFGMWTRVGPRNHVLDERPDPHTRGCNYDCAKRGRRGTCPDMSGGRYIQSDSVGGRTGTVRCGVYYMGCTAAQPSNMANALEPSMSGSDAALFQTTLTTCSFKL